MQTISNTLRFRGPQPVPSQEAVHSGVFDEIGDTRIDIPDRFGRAPGADRDLRLPALSPSLLADVVQNVSAHFFGQPGGLDTLEALQGVSTQTHEGCRPITLAIKKAAVKTAQNFNKAIYQNAAQISNFDAFVEEVRLSQEQGGVDSLDQTKIDEYQQLLDLKDQVALIKNNPNLMVGDLLSNPVRVKEVAQYLNLFGSKASLAKHSQNYAEFSRQYRAFAANQADHAINRIQVARRVAREHAGFGKLATLFINFISFKAKPIIESLMVSKAFGYEANTTARSILDYAGGGIALGCLAAVLANTTTGLMAAAYSHAIRARYDITKAQAADSFDPAIDYSLEKVFENNSWL